MFLGAFVTHTQIELLMAIYGLFISWIYTRFLKVQDGIRGDRSETFSFASFFPEFIQYVSLFISAWSMDLLFGSIGEQSLFF